MPRKNAVARENELTIGQVCARFKPWRYQGVRVPGSKSRAHLPFGRAPEPEKPRGEMRISLSRPIFVARGLL